MGDIVAIAILVAFFAVAGLLLRACDAMVGSVDDDR